MSEGADETSVDMIRWTFEVKPENREAIENHLKDLGFDVLVIGESEFHMTWDEPDREVEELASELWELNEEPFDITQEEFKCLGHFVIHAEDATDVTESQAA